MNTLYDKAGEAFLQANINWLTDTIRVALVTNRYDPDFEDDEYLSDIPQNSIVKISDPLTDKAIKGFTVDAAPVKMPALKGEKAFGVVFYQDMGSRYSSRLICYMDQADFLPFAPNGGDLTMKWERGKGIFTL